MTNLAKPCNTPGCPELRPCPTDGHEPKPWAGSTRRERLPKDWDKRRQRILRRDGHRCYVCGNPATEVDHITPGDDHHDQNLGAICAPCHKKKTAGEAAAARRFIVRE